MTKEILFIQGAGSGAHREDAELVKSLAKQLGNDYKVTYPEMPQEDDPDYDLWKPEIARQVAHAASPRILVAHSLGAYMLLKYLTENAPFQEPVAGIYLLSTPYPSGDENWQYDGFSLPEDFGTKLPEKAQVFLYHSRDDHMVSFAHAKLYVDAIPGAVVRTTTGGHQLGGDLTLVAADIKAV